jgi:hypothetical protein
MRAAAALVIAWLSLPAAAQNGALPPNGFLVLERGAFHFENGMVRVCPDLKSITAPNGQVGCFTAEDKAMGLARKMKQEPGLSLEQMLPLAFKGRRVAYTGMQYNKDKHELIVYYRID